jgi:hypothetical protein
LLTGGSDEDFGATDNPLLGNDLNNEEIAMGIRQFFIQTDDVNLSTQVGVKKEEFFAGVRFRGLKNLGNWNARFTKRLQYFTDEKFENHTALDFEAYWGDKWMFRATTGVLFSEREDGIPYGQYLRLVQVLSEYRALSYEAGVYLDTEPSHKVIDTQLIVRLRQRFYRDWLTLEVAPKVTFPEDRDYESNWGISVLFEASFGTSIYEGGDYQKIFR